MLRMTAVGAGAVDYLLRGSGCDHAKDRFLSDLARSEEPDAAGYFARGIEHGEPAGRWLGSGMEGLGLAARPGMEAGDDEVRAIFGQLRRPESSERDPEFIGSKPRRYRDEDARFAALVEKEPDATEERLRELRREAATNGRRAVAYYDLTFSPVKSVSVLYAAYLMAGDTGTADAIRAAHDRAVEIAMAYAEQHIAWTRRGGDGRTVGEYVQGTGLSAVAFSHSTNREAEPQLHTHVAVLNRLADEFGRIGALDGQAMRPVKEAIATAYERALEQLIHEATGAVFETRPDGLAREIVGVDPELCDDASTRRHQVVERLEDLVAAYRESHGHEPDAAARKAMAQAATLDTRRPKSNVAGPIAVATWAQERGQWCEAVVDAVDAAAIAARAATGGHGRVAGRMAGGHEVATPEQRQAWLEAAQRAGVADVQSRYSTWTIGNLVDAIDKHLGPATALGVPATERAMVLEDLARDAVSPTAGLDVVQLTGFEPTPVPDALLRASDGRPRFRPHIDERYATAEHLALEEHVVALASAEAGARIDDPHLRGRLDTMGLSIDQREAVVGIVESTRGGAVLIGPAGAGKSRTVGALAHEWRAATGGQVVGVATSQIATENLAGDSLRAINVATFLERFDGDTVRETLGERDLLVVDEAGMSSTADLQRLARIAAHAGARIVYAGDPEQLDAVGAGGLFAHLADTLHDAQRHDLEQVHRFSEQWEADASLRLRTGDHAVIDEYADRGRLHIGSLEEMQAGAVRAYLADTLEGRSSLLIVGTNDLAATVSRDVRERLVELGQVDARTITRLSDRNAVSVGDRIQARRNAYDLQVDAPVGENGHRGARRPVTNRESYTVIGLDEQGRVLARDDRDAVAHLPLGYLQRDAVLGYATTVHGAQGVTVDSAHPVLDRDASREHAYVGASRGRHENHLWMVTEREPDEHEPERVSEQAAERLAAILDNRGLQTAATPSRDDAQREVDSLTAVATRFDLVTGWDARDRHAALLDERLDPLHAHALRGDRGRDRLFRSLREAELAGHDTSRVLDETTERSLTGSDSVADVLRARIRTATAQREPERAVDSTDWASRAPAGDSEVGRYVRDVAELASQRQARLGQDAAERAPQWAVDALGEPPERHEGEGPVTEPRGRWEDLAGVAAAYREIAGIDDDQRSLGAAPSREREMQRALWRDAVDALGHSPTDGARDWRAAPDAELYAARERWVREQDAAPRWVADELAERHDLARQYREDAAFEQARLEAMPADDPERDDLGRWAQRSSFFAEHHRGAAEDLEVEHQNRRTWWEARAPEREADEAAADELARRNLPAERLPGPADRVDVDEPELNDVRDVPDEPAPAVERDEVREPEQQVVAEPEPDRFAAVREAQEKVTAARERLERLAAEQRELDEDEFIRSRYNAAEHHQQLERDMGGPELGDDW